MRPSGLRTTPLRAALKPSGEPGGVNVWTTAPAGVYSRRVEPLVTRTLLGMRGAAAVLVAAAAAVRARRTVCDGLPTGDSLVKRGGALRRLRTAGRTVT